MERFGATMLSVSVSSQGSFEWPELLAHILCSLYHCSDITSKADLLTVTIPRKLFVLTKFFGIAYTVLLES